MWKIGDFGFTSDAASGLIRSEARRGTSSYRAPELLRFSTFDDRVDIWALGCVLYELVCRKTAFKDDWEVTEYARQNTKINVPMRPFVDANARKPVLNLIHEMLRLRPNSRPSATDLCSLFDSIDGLFQGSADLPLLLQINTPSNQKLSRSVVFSVPPYGRNPYFSGRDDILDALFLELTVIKPNRYNHRVALYGLGGIGKTQLALEYAYRHEEDYAFVFWVSGADRPQLLSGFCEIARTVGCAASEKPEEIAARALQWLRDTEDWLLVIDNVDDTNVTDSYLPESKGGHTIITTRSPNSGALHAIGLEVPEMSRQNSIKFLLLRLGITDPTERILREIGDIIDALGGLPLAIDHAAAYINHPGKLFEYLPDFRAHRQELLGLRLPYSSLYNHTVVTTWKMSFERLEKKSPDSAELLQYFSLMNPDEILVEFLREGATALAPNLQNLLQDTFKWKESLRSLEDTSLVRVSQDRDRIRIHRLVQAVIQDGFGSERTIVASTTIHMGLQAFPSIDFSLKGLEKARRFRVEVIACLEATNNLHERSEWLELAERLANYLYWDGFYLDASRWWSSILEIRTKMFGEAHEATLRSMHRLACAWCKNAHLQEALTLSNVTLALRQKVLGLEHPDTLDTTHLLAAVYSGLREFGKSCAIEEKLVEIRMRVLGAEHPMTLNSMHGLAVVYSNLNRCKEAAELNAKTLEMRRRVLGHEHPDTLCSMRSLAVDYLNLNRYKEAAELNARTFEIRKRVLGPEHPDTLNSMRGLAIDYSNLNKHKEAEELNAKTLEMRKRVLGPEHPDTLRSMRSLAVDYLNLNRNNEAEALDAKTLEMRKRVLGPEHPDTLNSMHGLAVDYSNLNRHKEATVLNAKTLEMRMRVLGPEHPDTLKSMNSLAVNYSNLNRHREAAELDAKTLEIQKRVLGPEHPMTLNTMRGLAVDYSNLNRRKEAAELCEATLRTQQSVIGLQHRDTLRTMRTLAIAYSKLRRFKDAEYLYTETLEKQMLVLGAEDKDTVFTKNCMGRFLKAKARGSKPRGKALLISK